MAMDLIDRYFGVCFRRELVTIGELSVPQFAMIFNYSIVNQRDVIATNMRMCVAGAWRAMRRPSRVGDPQRAY